MLKNFGKDEFLKGSLVLMLSLGVFNILNYVFQISMARLLGPAEYGILAVLMSLAYIFNIPSEAIQTITSGYTSKFNVRRENGKIKDLMIRGLKKGLVFSAVAFLIFLLLSFWLSNLLRIPKYLLLVTGLVIVGSFITPITRGILQGTKRFFALGMNMILESALKVILAIVLVTAGFGAIGGIIGLALALLGAFILSFLPLKIILNSKRERNDFEKVYSYNLPGLIAVTSIVLIYSLDIIFARIFFSPIAAGQYAFVSLVGKAIFFANMAIGKAMFPLTSEKSE
ncbi:MAG: oligosaccharide flippase family protein, partial [Candidatus Pacearchaeota archaeon]|nr:oligosaccharide flippase family protein [Candidatus Pacearchaeota archaeon]